MIYAFYYNNLFPEQVFNISQSILIVLAPFVGGLGTLFGPILGAFVLETIAESMRVLLEGRRRLAGYEPTVVWRGVINGRDCAAGWCVAVDLQADGSDRAKP